MYRFTTLIAALLLPAAASATGTDTTTPRAETAVKVAVEVAMMRPTITTDAGAEPGIEARPRIDRKPLAARFAPASKLITLVDVSDQTMTVFVDGERAHVWKVSTGRKGYTTPKGTWKPYRMHTMWHSRKYNNAPMPHSIFYDGGYAIHATPHVNRLGRPASHGCVRLHPENAKALFDMVLEYGRDNMRVVVQN